MRTRVATTSVTCCPSWNWATWPTSTTCSTSACPSTNAIRSTWALERSRTSVWWLVVCVCVWLGVGRETQWSQIYSQNICDHWMSFTFVLKREEMLFKKQKRFSRPNWLPKWPNKMLRWTVWKTVWRFSFPILSGYPSERRFHQGVVRHEDLPHTQHPHHHGVVLETHHPDDTTPCAVGKVRWPYCFLDCKRDVSLLFIQIWRENRVQLSIDIGCIVGLRTMCVNWELLSNPKCMDIFVLAIHKSNRQPG